MVHPDYSFLIFAHPCLLWCWEGKYNQELSESEHLKGCSIPLVTRLTLFWTDEYWERRGQRPRIC